jgi:hypothetical protein
MKYLFLLLLLVSCVTREQVNAVVWKNNFPLPKELCDQIPELNQRGFYRKLNDRTMEGISICKKEARNMVTATEVDFNELMDRALPKPRKSKD